MGILIDVGIAFQIGGGTTTISLVGSAIVQGYQVEVVGSQKDNGWHVGITLNENLDVLHAVALLSRQLGMTSSILPADFPSFTLSSLSFLVDTTSESKALRITVGDGDWYKNTELRIASAPKSNSESRDFLFRLDLDPRQIELGKQLSMEQPIRLALTPIGLEFTLLDPVTFNPQSEPIAFSSLLPLPTSSPLDFGSDSPIDDVTTDDAPRRNDRPEPLLTLKGPYSLAPLVQKIAPAPNGASTAGTWRDYLSNFLRIENIGFRIVTESTSKNPRSADANTMGVGIELDASVAVGPWFSASVRRASVQLVPEKLFLTNIDATFAMEGAAVVVDVPNIFKLSAAVLYEQQAEAHRISGMGEVRIFGQLTIGVLLDLEWNSRGVEAGFGFVFAKDFQVGDPTTVMLTGIGGGFGYGRVFKLPSQAKDVPRNSLVQQLLASNDGPKPQNAQNLLKRLGDFQQSLERRPEAWCIAFGLTLKICQVLDCVALAIVEVRKPGYEVAVLGLADLPLGKGQAKLGHVQLALLVRVGSEDQSLRILGALTESSWLIDKRCKLRGGFAICVWFAGQHRGEFVVSFGGYSPLLPAKPHYPAIDRIGLTWNVSDQLRLSGGVYYAMDRYGIQFGCQAELKLTTQALTVDTRFVFDVLAQWAPAFFAAKLRLHVHIELRALITLRLSLDVGMDVYGPPFGADLHIKIDVAFFHTTVDLHLGATLAQAQASGKPTTQEGRRQLQTDTLRLAKGGDGDAISVTCAGRPARGRQTDPLLHYGQTRDDQEICPSVRADDLELTIATNLPVRSVYRTRKSPELLHTNSGNALDPIDVRPLQWKNVDSYLIWGLPNVSNDAEWQVDVESTRPVEALWYIPDKQGSAWSDSGRSAIARVRLRPPKGTRGTTELANIATSRLEKPRLDTVHSVISKATTTIEPRRATSTNVAMDSLSQNRQSFLDQLVLAGFDLGGCTAQAPFRPLDAKPLLVNRSARST